MNFRTANEAPILPALQSPTQIIETALQTLLYPAVLTKYIYVSYMAYLPKCFPASHSFLEKPASSARNAWKSAKFPAEVCSNN